MRAGLLACALVVIGAGCSTTGATQANAPKATTGVGADLSKNQVAEGFQTYDGLKEQFTIALPDGWSVYKQSEAITGKPSSLGIVVFSAQPLTKAGQTMADPDLMAQWDKGEMPSFFVDRHAAVKGMSCGKFSKTDAYNLGVRLTKDPIFGAVRQYFSVTPIKHYKIQIAGCQGFRYEGRAKKGEFDWVLDVRAVSDGKVLYLFSLRNRAENYAKNIDTFEKAIATLRLTAPE